MSESFDPRAASPLIVPVLVVPRKSVTIRCALDTGASRTVLPSDALRRSGVDFANPVDGGRLFSATGNARVLLVNVPAISALARVRTQLVVAAHDLPRSVEADGLLGRDSCGGFVLRIDFARGRIDLDPPRRWWQFWR